MNSNDEEKTLIDFYYWDILQKLKPELDEIRNIKNVGVRLLGIVDIKLKAYQAAIATVGAISVLMRDDTD